MGWQEAGDAWGWRAAEWAHLVEPGNMNLFLDVLDELSVGPDVGYFDVACGSGFALREASRRGARAAGIDASTQLVAIAAERAPGADVRAGDMTRLPWADDSFDIITSFNGAWDVDDAFTEMRRVLKPGGRLAMSFWGRVEEVDLWKAWVPMLLDMSPPDEHDGGLLDVGKEGVAEALLEEHGFRPGRRSSSICVQEYADVEVAARGLIANGPSWPAVMLHGEDAVLDRMRQLIAPFVSDSSGMVRISNEWAWITADG